MVIALDPIVEDRPPQALSNILQFVGRPKISDTRAHPSLCLTHTDRSPDEKTVNGSSSSVLISCSYQVRVHDCPIARRVFGTVYPIDLHRDARNIRSEQLSS